MATSPTPAPDQEQGAASGGTAPDMSQTAPASTSQNPSQAPANQLQMLLAQWYRAAQQMAATDPRLASGARKVADGIQEMQAAIVVPQQPTPATSQPM